MEPTLPIHLQHLNSQGILSCMSITQCSLGTSILYSIIHSKSWNPYYKYIIQFLKTKFIQSKLNQLDQFNKFYFQDISMLQDPSFLNFLNHFGECIISSKSTLDNSILLETLSRDLNIRLKIYVSGVLAVETSSYELSPALPVILNLPSSQYPLNVDYLLFEDHSSLSNFSLSLVSQNAKLIQEFSNKLADAYKTIPTSKALKAWAQGIRSNITTSKTCGILNKILHAPQSIHLTKDLKTSHRLMGSLKVFGFNYNEETRFLKTFAPMSEIGSLREPLKPYQFTEEQLKAMEEYERDSSSESEESMRKKIVVCGEPTNEPIDFGDEPEESNEGHTSEVYNYAMAHPSENVSMPPGASSNQGYAPQSFSGFSGSSGFSGPSGPPGPPGSSGSSGSSAAHCQKCSSNPVDLDVTLNCKCKLSEECMKESLITRTCVKCNSEISESKFSDLGPYFDL